MLQRGQKLYSMAWLHSLIKHEKSTCFFGIASKFSSKLGDIQQPTCLSTFDSPEYIFFYEEFFYVQSKFHVWIRFIMKSLLLPYAYNKDVYQHKPMLNCVFVIHICIKQLFLFICLFDFLLNVHNKQLKSC